MAGLRFLADTEDFDGGRTRARTLDPLIKSQLLYQLSYAPIAPVRRSRQAEGRRLAKARERVQRKRALEERPKRIAVRRLGRP